MYRSLPAVEPHSNPPIHATRGLPQNTARWHECAALARRSTARSASLAITAARPRVASRANLESAPSRTRSWQTHSSSDDGAHSRGLRIQVAARVVSRDFVLFEQ